MIGEGIALLLEIGNHDLLARPLGDPTSDDDTVAAAGIDALLE